MTKSILKTFCTALMLLLSACGNNNNTATTGQKEAAEIKQEKIVSISGTTTEILCALGMQDQIVGVDVTSTYPEAMTKLPGVGHNRSMSAEAIIALAPSIVIGVDENVKPELVEQLKSAHIRVLLYNLETSVEGTKKLIKGIADSLEKSDKVQEIVNGIDADLKEKVALSKKTKVLFIYARGAGTMMVAGEKTSSNAMINLAGGENAVTGFEDFKPLTPESLLQANPDVILMFTSGLESLGGMEGLLKVPGVAMTNAGKKKQVIEMDGQFLTGFGTRLGKAVAALSKKLDAVNKN
ncbi:MAG: ABC transporter substrate-binding protein [Chitinophagaceae bacterium]|jgi:iron complex transport system substrate-binding protein